MLFRSVSDKTTHDNNTHTLYHVKPRLKIGGVTVAALPYLEHADPSVKRRSGWLVPDINAGHAYGVGLVTPYFWAIAPDKDLTFRPMFTALQGPVPVVTGGYRLGDVRHITADSARIRTVLGWQPEVGFADGMAELALDQG